MPIKVVLLRRETCEVGRIAAGEIRRFEKPISFSETRSSTATKQKSEGSVPQLFLIALVVPILLYLGPLRLSPYRLVLIVTFIPCLFAWLSGSVGRMRAPDIFIFLTAIWGAIVLLHLHGVDAGIQSAGIFVVETLGSYILARRYIRNVYAFRRMVRCLVLIVLFLLPFAAYENLTGSPILLQVFGSVFDVHAVAPKEPRWGLARAQGVFEHPILFGVICSSAFALSYYALNSLRHLAGRLTSGFVALTVFTSLSAGALLSIAVQSILIVWDELTARVGRRWAALAAITSVVYIVVEMVSNRSAFQVFISYLTFNADQSYMRIHIWNYGVESVMQHPIFGVGLNEWAHPEWMTGSIDNFWLGNAVTFGLPGAIFIGCAVLSLFFGLARISFTSDEISQCRKGLITSLIGLTVAACTVHLWNASYVLFIFLMGSGVWLFEARQTKLGGVKRLWNEGG